MSIVPAHLIPRMMRPIPLIDNFLNMIIVTFDTKAHWPLFRFVR